MKRTPAVITTLLMTGAFALMACEQQGGADGASGKAQTAPDAEIVIPDDVSVPSTEEAAADAERTINADNADAAFEELSREIEADDAGGG